MGVILGRIALVARIIRAEPGLEDRKTLLHLTTTTR
jgi:hypothetical protein